MELAYKIPFNSFLTGPFLFLFAQLVVLAVYRLVLGVNWVQLLKSFFAQYSHKLTNKRGGGANLFIVFGLLNLSYFILMVALQNGFQPFQISAFPAFSLLTLLTAVWVIGNLLVHSTGLWLSLEHPIFERLSSSFLQFFRFFGLAGVPFNFLLTFSAGSIQQIVQIVLLGVVCAMLVRRLVLLVYDAFQMRISFWYIILYLCALEIIPFLCLLKMTF